MDTLTLFLALTLAIPCLTLHAEAGTTALDWDYPTDPLLEGFRVWRTAGACPQDVRPATPVASVPAYDLDGRPVRTATDLTAPATSMACWTVTALRAWLPTAPVWTRCATEDQSCAVPNRPTVVRYGTNGSYAYLTTTTTVPCANSVFGDPTWGVVKECHTTPALGPAQESPPSNAVQQPASGIVAPSRFKLLPQ